MATTTRPKRVATPQRMQSSRARAAARQRALARLAREFADRYREIYAEERGESC